MDSLNTLSIEKQLVILTSRITFTKEEMELVENIVANYNINWFEFLKLASYHKTLVLAVNNIKSFANSAFLPKYLYDIINYIYVCTKIRNEENQKEIKAITESCTKMNISCIPVKGSYLIPLLYKDYGVRYSGDMDFLIRFDDISKVSDIIKTMGYSNGKFNNETQLIDPISRIEEIKWKTHMSNLHPYYKLSENKLFPYYKLDFRFALDDSLSRESVNEIVDTTKQYGSTLPIHYLIHLCTHYYDEAKHTISIFRGKDFNLIKLCDIREYILGFINIEEINCLINFADKYTLQKPVYYTMYCLSLIYNDGYEEKIMHKLNISDTDFINKYGENTKTEDKTFEKGFWERLFSCDNSGELHVCPKFFEE